MDQTKRYPIVMYIAHVALAFGIRLLTELSFKKDLTKIFIFGVVDQRQCGHHVYSGICLVRSIVIAIAVVNGGVIFQGKFPAD